MKNILPDFIIEIFHKRIENKLKMGHIKDSQSIQMELDRIILLNGFIPDKINKLLK